MAGRGADEGRRKLPGSGWRKASRPRPEARPQGQKSRDGAPEGAASRKRRAHELMVAPFGAPSPSHGAREKSCLAKAGETSVPGARQKTRAAELWLFEKRIGTRMRDANSLSLPRQWGGWPARSDSERGSGGGGASQESFEESPPPRSPRSGSASDPPHPGRDKKQRGGIRKNARPKTAAEWRADCATGSDWSMIPKSGNRFSEKIMLKQNVRSAL